MRICAKCGARFQDIGHFCPHDGSPLLTITNEGASATLAPGMSVTVTQEGNVSDKTCPDDGTCGAFLDGTLTQSQSSEFEQHLDDCSTCQERLARGVRSRMDEQARQAVETHSILYEVPGRYAIHEECGRGGQARVMLAFDHALGRNVAFKQLLPDLLGCRHKPAAYPSPSPTSERVVARFLREARIAAQLLHPSIIPVYEIGRREDHSLYYTMLLVKGDTLGQALAKCEDLPQRVHLLSHFLSLCQAMAFAHSRGVRARSQKGVV